VAIPITLAIGLYNILQSKSSAVAEMGDSARAKRADKWGTAVLLSVGARPASIPSGILIHPAGWPQ